MRHLALECYLIEVDRRIYASVSWAIINSDNALSPYRHQAIIWTSTELLLIGPRGNYFS